MTLTENEFIELTNKFSQYKNNFSYDGKKALFKYLEEFEEDTGEKIEFDYIVLCCDYSEHDNLNELLENYKDIDTIEQLEERTNIIKFNNKYIIKEF